MALNPNADNFNEPQTDDTTSSPSLPQLPNAGYRPQANEQSPVLSRLKQMASMKSASKAQKSPGLLAAKMRAKRARPMTYKYGG